MTLFTNPTLIFTENIKHIVGSGAADNAEDLFHLYLEVHFEVCYQFAAAIVELHNNLDYFELEDHDFGDVIKHCRHALEDYQKSSKSFEDKKDFVRWIDAGCYKSF